MFLQMTIDWIEFSKNYGLPITILLIGLIIISKEYFKLQKRNQELNNILKENMDKTIRDQQELFNRQISQLKEITDRYYETVLKLKEMLKK